MLAPLTFSPLTPWVRPTPTGATPSSTPKGSSAPADLRQAPPAPALADAAFEHTHTAAAPTASSSMMYGLSCPNGYDMLPPSKSLMPPRRVDTLHFETLGLRYHGQVVNDTMSGEGTMWRGDTALFAGTFLTTFSWQRSRVVTTCQVYEPGGVRLHTFALAPQDNPACPWVPRWETLRSEYCKPSDWA